MKTHDYTHYYKGYWSDGGKCRIRVYHEDGHAPVVIYSQLPDNENTSVTNMAEYLVAEVIEEHDLSTPLVWVEHYSKHRSRLGEYCLARFSSWKRREVCLGGVWCWRVGSPRWFTVASPGGTSRLEVRSPRATAVAPCGSSGLARTSNLPPVLGLMSCITGSTGGRKKVCGSCSCPFS